MEISIVIPVYNSENSIEIVVYNLYQNSFLQTKIWELILVDDCSTDDSFQCIEQLAKNQANLIGLSLHKNVGQHSATLAGIHQAKGEVLITMDDDGEHPDHFIETLYQTITTRRIDVAFAIPSSSNKSLIRKGISSLFKQSAKWFSDGYGNGSAFRAIRKSIYCQLKDHTMPFVFIDEILAWYTKNVTFLECSFNSSQKKSTYKTVNLFSLYNNIMFTYSSFPAQFLTKVGIGGSIISFLVGVFYVIKKIYFKAQLGFTSIAVSILFSASIILMGLGIIAQYIYRQNRLLNQFPQYSIRKNTNEKF